MGRVLILALGLQVVFQAGLPQRDQRRPMPLDGARLPDGCSDTRDANLHHGLVIVIG